MAPRRSGELPAPAPFEGNAYGPATLEAVKRFQRRHGLDPDGVIGKRTVQALNVTIEQRIQQVEINLERWRWMPRDLGRRHISVNTADFTLKVVEDGHVVMEMPVIVGRPFRRTPRPTRPRSRGACTGGFPRRASWSLCGRATAMPRAPSSACARPAPTRSSPAFPRPSRLSRPDQGQTTFLVADSRSS